MADNEAGAKVLGNEDLKQEKSNSFSAGLVLRPLPRLTITVDAYQIKLRDRIVGTATIFTNAPTFDPDDLIWQSIVTSGFGVEEVPNVAASSFINGPRPHPRCAIGRTSWRERVCP